MHNPRVLILGGGIAGLEAAFHLCDRLRDRVDVTLVSRDDRFVLKQIRSTRVGGGRS